MSKSKNKRANQMTSTKPEQDQAPSPDSTDIANDAVETTDAESAEEQQLDVKASEIAESGEVEPLESPSDEQSSNEVNEANEAAAAVIAETMMDPKLRVEHDTLAARLANYRDSMAPGKPIANVNVGAENQLRLWRIIDGVLRNRTSSFGPLFTQLLNFLHAESGKGVMSAKLRYRFFGALPLGADEGRSFESILSTLVLLSDPKLRALHLKKVSIPATFARYIDKTAVDRVTDYFGV